MPPAVIVPGGRTVLQVQQHYRLRFRTNSNLPSKLESKTSLTARRTFTPQFETRTRVLCAARCYFHMRERSRTEPDGDAGRDSAQRRAARGSAPGLPPQPSDGAPGPAPSSAETQPGRPRPLGPRKPARGPMLRPRVRGLLEGLGGPTASVRVRPGPQATVAPAPSCPSSAFCNTCWGRGGDPPGPGAPTGR